MARTSSSRSRGSASRGSTGRGRSGGATSGRNAGGAGRTTRSARSVRGGSASRSGASAGAVRSRATSQDAIDLLTRDHDKVADLFRRFESASGREKERIFGQIDDELTVHAEIEEQIFYPAVERMRSEDSREMVKEAHQEHDKVKELLDEISAKVGEAEDFDSKVTELKENVEHHVAEEEGEMFPEVRQVLGAARLRELGAEMRELKQQLEGEPGQARRPVARGRRRSPEAAT